MSTVADFHRAYYEAGVAGGIWKATTWLGVQTWKCPLDLWVYQEIIHEQRPDLVIETGTAYGGSALFMATIFDAVGHGEIITIDLDDVSWPSRPEHPRITYITASSTDPAIVAELADHASRLERVMVVLDSDHSAEHVYNELCAYAPMVTPGSYLIVEDTNINGHPVYETFGPGPMEAAQKFLQETTEFAMDETREKFLLTFNPGGWLRR
jgi:cephalosporin hydroxylase